MVERSIGTATMDEDGTLILQLRAETETGIIGDSLLRIDKNHPKYQEYLDHIGGLNPGESKEDPPWPK